jgi:hypothetical protein
VKDRGMCGSGERNIQISADSSEVSQILPHFTLMTTEREDDMFLSSIVSPE